MPKSYPLLLVVLFDQRGLGTSSPSLDCPEVHQSVVQEFPGAVRGSDDFSLALAALARQVASRQAV